MEETPPVDPIQSSRRWALPAALIAGAIAALVVVLPVLGAGFAPLGDAESLTSHDRWHGLDGERLSWMFETVRGGWSRPLAWISYGFDAVIAGPDATGIHRTSWLLHGVRGALVVALIARLVLCGISSSETKRRHWATLVAAAAGIAWAVHPLRVEAVAWASVRGELLAGVLWPAAALVWLRAMAGPALRIPSLLAAAGLGCLAVLADPLSLGAAAGIALLTIWVAHNDTASFAGQATRGARFACAAPLLVAVFVGVVLATAAGADAGPPLASAAGGAALSAGVLRALRTTLWPGWLHPAYGPPPGFPEDLGPALVMDAVLLAVLITLTAHGLLKRRGSGLAGLTFFAVLVPPLVLGHDRFGADRYADLATIPFFVGLAHALTRPAVSSRAGRAGLAGLAIACVVLATASVHQAGHWKSRDALLDHVLEIDPANEAALVARGEAALATDDLFASSSAYARRALEGGGARPRAHALYGRILLELGDPAAERHLRSAIEGAPWLPAAHHDLGVWLLRRDAFREALALFEHAARFDSRSASVWFGIGRAREQLGEPESAAVAYRRALELGPGDAALESALERLERTD